MPLLGAGLRLSQGSEHCMTRDLHTRVCGAALPHDGSSSPWVGCQRQGKGFRGDTILGQICLDLLTGF